jgi:hypothetical protein
MILHFNGLLDLGADALEQVALRLDRQVGHPGYVVQQGH